MKKLFALFIFSICMRAGLSQPIATQLAQAVQQAEADTQLRHAILSLCVVDAQTGKPVYAHNAQTGLAAASSQKLFTSVAAFELLGNTYRYKTQIGWSGAVKNGSLNGNLYITGYGDPTLGSWRWNDTKDAVVLEKIAAALKKLNITSITGDIVLVDTAFSLQPIPGGWIWDDMGNYYGAGCWALNWHENQYDLQLMPGKKEGDTTHITGTVPTLQNAVLTNHITTGKKGSGDNGYIYLPPYGTNGFTEGTIPPGEESFSISGAFTDGPLQLGYALQQYLAQQHITVAGSCRHFDKQQASGTQRVLMTLSSPPLDSINYWFLKKSINLYGEALVKTMAYEKNRFGSTQEGVELVRNFWSEHGIDKGAINIIDGSGLSPQNRVTTNAEVKVLQFAKTRSWFPAFYNALPEYNGMKMKSGSIGGARAFAGYHTAKDGKQYIFSIIVNNYDGSAGDAVKKLFKVLDLLK